MNYLYLVIAILFETVATSALKSSEGFTKPIPAIVVVIGYGVAFFCLSLTHRTIPLGIAYAIWSGVGIALVSLIGWLVFKQTLDIFAITGIAFIITGVAIMNVFSKTSGH